MAVELDVNAEMYPVYVGDKLKMVLAPTLNLDGTPVTNFVSLARGKSLADDFDYVMHGTLYDITKKGSEPNIKQVIHVSFGGLLLELEGDLPKLAIFKRDQTMFLLLKKVQKSLTFKK
ncbi:DNA-directed RNA polymerases II and V subunit 8A-like isoform X2 [Malania oleifera]|nr:DNA-directed RNA polymerases II and V subunit 8A-like isoform X2 [Malania oleifera]